MGIGQARLPDPNLTVTVVAARKAIYGVKVGAGAFTLAVPSPTEKALSFFELLLLLLL